MSSYQRMGALGSSFAAGPGIEPIEDVDAGRSANNYAHRLARRLGAQLFDLSVSGATTSNVVDTAQQSAMGTTEFPPQIHGLPADVELVTVTVGGNDLQFMGAMLSTALVHDDPSNPLLEMMGPMLPQGIPAASKAVVAEAVQGLVRVIDGVRSKAPAARIVLVDYLTVLSPDIANLGAIPFSESELSKLLELQHAVERVFAEAAAQTDVELLRASALSREHSLGSAEPWVQAFSSDVEKLGGSFHPNEAGMAAIADALADLVTS